VVTGLGLFVFASLAAASTVTVRSARVGALGIVLVTTSGRTLYHDSAENKGSVTCTGSCAKEWKPLLLPLGSKAVAGSGVIASLLGRVKRPGGTTVQITYHGMPLYLYSGDTKAGQATGQGSGGIWHAVAPSGLIVTKPATTAQSGSDASSSSGGSTSGSGSSSTAGPGSTSGSGSSYGGGTTTTNPCTSDPNSQACYDQGM
jgi:predicted lipoprotein with Yx(FWY)xxD motif